MNRFPDTCDGPAHGRVRQGPETGIVIGGGFVVLDIDSRFQIAQGGFSRRVDLQVRIEGRKLRCVGYAPAPRRYQRNARRTRLLLLIDAGQLA